MKALDICKQNIPVAKARNIGTKERIKADYPEVVEWAKEITEEFGPYAGMRVRVDGETIFEWRK